MAFAGALLPTSVPMSTPASLPESLAARITSVDSRLVLLDLDLARLHQVPLRDLRTLVRQNFGHFPGDLCFQPEQGQLQEDLHHQPDAFTEQGAWMVAALLGTTDGRLRTIELSRAFGRVSRRTPGLR